jgi:hypothetical protein
MTTLEIKIDEATAEVVRQKARQAGKTPEAWVSEVVAQQAAPPGSNEWIKGFLESAEKSTGNSGGWKWNREELYDR